MNDEPRIDDGPIDRWRIDEGLALPWAELQFSAIRAQGPGGQNVNKVASAIQLHFDIKASSLPEPIRRRLLARADRRLRDDGVLVIKAQRFRTQERNRSDALERLAELIRAAAQAPKARKATQPSRAQRRKRLDDKKKRSRLKAMRRSVD